MTPEAVRRLALSLPEACELPHFERTSFRVGKKIFAALTADGREAMVKVPEPGVIESLLESYPATFFSHGTWTTRNGALGVRLRHIEAALMKELVTQAWMSVASKRALAAFEGEN